MTALGIVLILYGLATAAITIWKPPRIWGIAKIQGFVSALTERGTEIFFLIWATAAVVAGIVILT